MMATRSHSRSASSSRWVVRKTETPRSRSAVIRMFTSCEATGSSPEVGSSRNMTCGSFSRVRASAARWRRPLDRFPAKSWARSVRLTAARASAIRCSRRGSPYSRAKKSRFSATVSRRYRPGASGMIEMRWRISSALAGSSGSPATTADPDVGAIRVPRIRTVVVLPAPLGPKKPNTSPRATRNDTSATAVREPKTLVRWLTSIAAAGPRAASGGRVGLEDDPETALIASPPRSSDAVGNILVLIELMAQGGGCSEREALAIACFYGARQTWPDRPAGLQALPGDDDLRTAKRREHGGREPRPGRRRGHRLSRFLRRVSAGRGPEHAGHHRGDPRPLAAGQAGPVHRGHQVLRPDRTRAI